MKKAFSSDTKNQISQLKFSFLALIFSILIYFSDLLPKFFVLILFIQCSTMIILNCLILGYKYFKKNRKIT